MLMPGHLLLYHPAIVAMQELLQAGELGRLEYIYSNRLAMGKIRREENALWSFAPHDISIILSMMGQLPIQVTAVGGAYLQPNIADVTVSNLLLDWGRRAADSEPARERGLPMRERHRRHCVCRLARTRLA